MPVNFIFEREKNVEEQVIKILWDQRIKGAAQRCKVHGKLMKATWHAGETGKYHHSYRESEPQRTSVSCLKSHIILGQRWDCRIQSSWPQILCFSHKRLPWKANQCISHFDYGRSGMWLILFGIYPRQGGKHSIVLDWSKENPGKCCNCIWKEPEPDY